LVREQFQEQAGYAISRDSLDHLPDSQDS